ncbi:hypothetical protein TREMEDRAFT_66497 [Tremella mesenterica DSM 1558]|uniref:uncharacterized protein n=1 Tax=Tremella mesenterica (strain ATCC 24925 / CBS 8224 / DSM 1558 / NBRC 9311 / NRRL Y-6157 / RJB 2259-6 / UBC 559-6) TaxID=578456 RepID=UPI00032BF59C|nr:uncharacterized protein TREMEDRAFT_66497 [Tremella mesenterica DSM 1558]EIW65505.1 hypothetical protein TREMEDRAFT_66497 [Tremella mesenterica DSM 1558]
MSTPLLIPFRARLRLVRHPGKADSKRMASPPGVNINVLELDRGGHVSSPEGMREYGPIPPYVTRDTTMIHYMNLPLGYTYAFSISQKPRVTSHILHVAVTIT